MMFLAWFKHSYEIWQNMSALKPITVLRILPNAIFNLTKYCNFNDFVDMEDNGSKNFDKILHGDFK